MLNARLAQLPDSPFDRLRSLLDPLTPKAGVDPLMMSLGEPQHPCPQMVIEALKAEESAFKKYPPMPGTPELRTAITNWLTRRFGLEAGYVAAEAEIAPVSGTREGLFMLAQVAVPQEVNGKQPVVMMPNPFYQCYAGAAVLNGAEALYLPAYKEHDFMPDFDAVSEETWDRTAMVYLCSPANPQGTFASKDLMIKLVKLAREKDFLLVMDECYSEIYDREAPVGIFEVCAELGGGLKNVVAVHSLSKRSNAAGLRSGFVAGDPDVVKAFLKVRAYGGAAPPIPTMHASAKLWDDDAHVIENRGLYQEKTNRAAKILGTDLGFYRPPGGFFLWLDVGDGEAAAKALWQEGAVRVLPGAYLSRDVAGHPNPGHEFIRVALVHDADVVEEAMQRMKDILG